MLEAINNFDKLCTHFSLIATKLSQYLLKVVASAG